MDQRSSVSSSLVPMNVPASISRGTRIWILLTICLTAGSARLPLHTSYLPPGESNSLIRSPGGVQVLGTCLMAVSKSLLRWKATVFVFVLSLLCLKRFRFRLTFRYEVGQGGRDVGWLRLSD